MANVLGELFGDIAEAIRSKTGETGTMKPAEFPDRINAIEAGGVEIDPYYQRLAEAVITRNASYLNGDETRMSMKGFVLSDGNTLGSLASYSFAGFNKVRYMEFSDVVMVSPDAFQGDSALKIIDVTVSKALNTSVFLSGSLSGCSSLEALIFRDGGAGIASASVAIDHGGNDTFYIYVPSAYYDTIVSRLTSNNVSAARYRKLEDYPEIDCWTEEV